MDALIAEANLIFENKLFSKALDLYLVIVGKYTPVPGHVYYRLGVLHSGGRFSAIKVKDVANHYFRLAHEQLQKESDNAESLCDLGFLYNNGHGCTHDATRAFDYYRRAALLGFRRAQFNLGCMYVAGHGVTQDSKLAHHFFQLAADKGEKDGMYQTAIMCLKLKQYPLAMKYFFLGAEFQHKEATDNLRTIFKSKNGTRQNLEGILFISQEWPRSHGWLHCNCGSAIRELFFCLKGNIEITVPVELIILMTKELILIWKESHFIGTKLDQSQAQI